MRDLLKIPPHAKNLWPYYLIVTIASVLLALSNQLWPVVEKTAAELKSTSSLQGHSADMMQVVWLALVLSDPTLRRRSISNWGGHDGDIMSAKLKKQLSAVSTSICLHCRRAITTTS